jgi:ABC-type antimicrobial peptide transport system permease subunit
VAIVNAAFQRKHFGNSSALGHRLRTVANGNQPGPWRDIVGVVSTVRMLGPFNNPNVDDSGFYVPFYASVFGPVQPTPFVNQFTTVVLKPRNGTPESLANVLRRDISKLDPNLPLYFVGTPKAQIDGFVAQNRIIAIMFTVFGAVAILLASVGIYGVMSFSVNQRTQEFGVRMALGADRRSILTMVLRQGSIQVAIGAAIGLGLALAIAAVAGTGIQNVLFNVNARDPWIYSSVIALVAIVSLIATLVPARRATEVDPLVALRQ